MQITVACEVWDNNSICLDNNNCLYNNNICLDVYGKFFTWHSFLLIPLWKITAIGFFYSNVL